MTNTVRKINPTTRTLFALAASALGLLSYGKIGQAASFSLHNADDELLELHREVSFGGGATYQNYREKQDGGGTLDKEEGWMPNVQGSASWLFNNGIFVNANVNYAWGDTDYTGGVTDLNTGQHSPYKGHTRNDIVDVQGKIGYAMSPGSNWLITPYLTYGHRYWDRDLGNPQEKYNTNYIGGGLIVDYKIMPRLVASLDAMGATTFANDLDVKSRNSRLSNTSHSLGDEPMAKVKLGLDYALEDNWHLYGAVNYTYFSYGRSDNTDATYHGSYLGIPYTAQVPVYEPKSHTHNVDLDLGVRFTF